MHASLSDIVADVAANSIEARAAKVEVSVVEENGVVTLSVKDNGKGMDEATQRRAMDPFWTEPGKHPGRKVGLGLPFLKQAADQCGGSMSLESAPGVGTTVRFRFDEANVDAPPTGDVPAMLVQLMTWPGEGDFSVRREIDGRTYEVRRSELAEALGGLHTGGALSMMNDFFASNEAELENPI